MDSDKKTQKSKLMVPLLGRMLRIALNLLRDHISRKDLYGHLIPKAFLQEQGKNNKSSWAFC